MQKIIKVEDILTTTTLIDRNYQECEYMCEEFENVLKVFLRIVVVQIIASYVVIARCFKILVLIVKVFRKYLVFLFLIKNVDLLSS